MEYSDNEIKISSANNDLTNLSKFKYKNILMNNFSRKFIYLEGSFINYDGTALVGLEKVPFNKEEVDEIINNKLPLMKQLHNDIYGNYTLNSIGNVDSYKVTVIHPASEKHILKYSDQNIYLLMETPKIYKDIIFPYLQNNSLNLQWVYNILEKKSESEKIIFEDSDHDVGFLLLPDMKWNGEQIENLHVIALAKRNIMSLRELTSSDLPLLENILTKGSLRVFVHYPPSYYHLHVHFTHLKYEAPGYTCERGHILKTVISNIEICSNYYQRITLPHMIRQKDPLFQILTEQDCL